MKCLSNDNRSTTNGMWCAYSVVVDPGQVCMHPLTHEEIVSREVAREVLSLGSALVTVLVMMLTILRS